MAPKLSPEKEKLVVQAYKTPGLPVRKIAEMFEISRQTVYNIVSRFTEADLGQSPPDHDNGGESLSSQP